MPYYIFKVKTNKKEVWNGTATDFQHAAELACNAFLCPLRAIVKVELVKVID